MIITPATCSIHLSICPQSRRDEWCAAFDTCFSCQPPSPHPSPLHSPLTFHPSPLTPHPSPLTPPPSTHPSPLTLSGIINSDSGAHIILRTA
jgi:hypothetical protein